jgi:flagellin-like protein
VRRIRSRKAVSPVLAAVILVAVAITVAVAVAYWMSGIASQYTKFEKVEVQSAWSVLQSGTGWTITCELKNAGSETATLMRVFINEVPLNSTGYSESGFPAGADMVGTSIAMAGTPLTSGNSTTAYVWIKDGYATLSSGTTIDLKIRSAGGMDYIKLVELV